jgi:hypothetical protein
MGFRLFLVVRPRFFRACLRDDGAAIQPGWLQCSRGRWSFPPRANRSGSYRFAHGQWRLLHERLRAGLAVKRLLLAKRQYWQQGMLLPTCWRLVKRWLPMKHRKRLQFPWATRPPSV